MLDKCVEVQYNKDIKIHSEISNQETLLQRNKRKEKT